MDGDRFDDLIKRLGTTRLTRLTALRGLAVGALAATLGIAAPDEADAKRKKSCSECQKKKKHKSNFSVIYDSGQIPCRINHGSGAASFHRSGADLLGRCVVKHKLQWARPPEGTAPPFLLRST